MTTDAEAFLNTLANGSVNKDKRLIMVAFEGNPMNVDKTAWRPRAWLPSRELPFSAKHNVYVTIASFGRMPDDRTFRRRKDTFKAGLALMIDDVGTKVPISKVKGREPTMAVETSPKNFQLWYCLKEPERDKDRFGAMIDAFIRGQLLGKDPGMAGVTRVGRLPGFTNGKSDYNGWITKLTHLNPERRFTIDDLCSMFDLTLAPPPSLRLVTNDLAEQRVRAFFTFKNFLQHRGMLKRKAPDPSGWIEMHCPWKDDHTAGADNGAAIHEPRVENQFYGAFKCHHTSCSGRGWKELTEWITELAVEEVN